MYLDPELVVEVATELGVESGFIEKDWYAVQVLAAIAANDNPNISTVFCGGTNLSKAYGLLKRFSEDLDFRAKYDHSDSMTYNKPARRQFRAEIISRIETLNSIATNKIEPDIGGNYFKFELDYSSQVEQSSVLRPKLKVEYSFTQPKLDFEIKTIQSFVSQFQGLNPETEILCLSPVETAADKLSALTWRVLKRNRKDTNDDPTMIRHLHDLCALSAIVEDNSQVLVDTALASFEIDQQSGSRVIDKSLFECIQASYQKLSSDQEYEDEYVRFVDAMSYADDLETIDFKSALGNLKSLVSLFE